MLGFSPVSVVIVCAFCKPAKSVNSPSRPGHLLADSDTRRRTELWLPTRPLTERIKSLKTNSDGGNPRVASNLPAWKTLHNPNVSFT